MYWEVIGRGVDRMGWVVDEVDSFVVRVLGGWDVLEVFIVDSGFKGVGG